MQYVGFIIYTNESYELDRIQLSYEFRFLCFMSKESFPCIF